MKTYLVTYKLKGVLKHFIGLDSSLRGIILMAKPPDDQTFDRVVCLINDALKVN